MKLYYSPGACSLAPHIVLEEIGRPYQTHLVSSMDGSTKTAEYLEINPKGRVPVLDTGTDVITEVPAIMTYLARTYPESKLLDDSPINFARALEWMNWLASGVHALPVAQIWRVERFADDPDAYSSIKRQGMLNLESSYQMIEQKLQELPDLWVIGNSYSIVDAYLLVFYRWGNRLGLDMKPTFPVWTKHALALLEREAVQKVLEHEQISIWE